MVTEYYKDSHTTDYYKDSIYVDSQSYDIYNCSYKFEEVYIDYDEREQLKTGWGFKEKLHSQFKQQFNRTSWFRIRSRTFKIKY